MSETRGKRGGCLRYGCLGCLGVVGLFVVVVVILALIGLFAGRGGGPMERMEQTQSLPAGSAEWDRGDNAIPELTRSLPPGAVGRVELDLTMGRFEIVAGEPGEDIRIESHYKSDVYRLDPSLETAEDGGWVYRLKFSRKGGWLTTMFADEDNDNRVRLILPRDVPFVLEGEIGVGQSIMELGGLWVVDTDLVLGTGEHIIRFDEPLPEPMRSLRIDGSVGQLTLDWVGNASPAEIYVEHSVGEVRLDLRGEWLRDAGVELRCGIGQCGVEVPDRATLDLISSGVWIGESTQSAVRRSNERQSPDSPVVRLRSSTKIGELHFSD